MKRLILFTGLLLMVTAVFSQQKVRVHNSGNTMLAKELTSLDSIKLGSSYAKFKMLDSTSTLNIQKRFIDSLTFTTSTVVQDKIYIIYNGTDKATIINPYQASGVSIVASAGTVTVAATSGIANLEYNLLGSSGNGSLTIATDQDIRLVMNNLSLTNPSGAALTVSGGKTTNLLLTTGTTNTLTDDSSSTKNGTITTDGPIVINNSGALSINGIKRHGINTSSTINLLNGTTTVAAAASDGFHSEGYSMSGGMATITSLADGIDAGNGAIAISGGTINITSTAADVKGIKTGTNTIFVTGGTINMTVSGAQSKAISAKGNITFNSGTVGIIISGATVLTASGSGYDPSHAAAIKSDAVVTITGGVFVITSQSSANGGRGISADGGIVISGGNFTITTAGNGGSYTNTLGVADTYSTSALNTNTTMQLSGGTFTLTNTGADGKNLSADGNITISGTAYLTLNNSGASGKGIKSDATVTFDGGTTAINLSGATVLTASGSGYDPSYPTGVKAETGMVVNSGMITIQGTSAATGMKGLSSDATITVNGGNIAISSAGAGAVYVNASGVTDSYSSAALSADTDIIINAGTISTTSSGSAGKGLKADGTITIGTSTTNPTLTITTTGARLFVSGSDYSHPKTIVAAGAITINNGLNTISSTDDGIHSDVSVTINGGTNNVSAISATSGVGEGIEAPMITIAGGTTNVVASNDGINATYDTVTGGAESNDGSHLYITGGILIVAGSDAIDSNGNITITGGTTIVCGPTNGPEEGLDFNGTFNMNGGLLISAGSNSNMTKAMSTTSTQRGLYLKSSGQLAATSILRVENTSGTEVVTFKPKNAVYYFHVSRSNIAASTQYRVYFGGSYTGGSFTGGATTWGLYTGGTYNSSGAVLKTTATTSASSTVTTVTF